MYSNDLLTVCEEKLILTGYSSYHRCQLLLDHVRHMQPKMLVIFCEFVQEITPSVGQQLVTGITTAISMAIELMCVCFYSTTILSN